MKAFALLLLFCLCANTGALAQVPDSIAVADAAVADVRTLMRSPDAARVRSDSARSALISCDTRRPSSCRLQGVTGIILVHSLEVRGTAAVVALSTWEATGFERRPIQRITRRLTLQKLDGRWVVVRREIGSLT